MVTHVQDRASECRLMSRHDLPQIITIKNIRIPSKQILIYIYINMIRHTIYIYIDIYIVIFIIRHNLMDIQFTNHDPSQLSASSSPLCFHLCRAAVPAVARHGAFQDLLSEGSGSRGHENTWWLLKNVPGKLMGNSWKRWKNIGKPYEVMKLSRIWKVI